jgi:phosphoglycerate kinase
MRVDFNVPIEEIDGKIRITDDTRVWESLPTIELLSAKGAKVILLAHFGRPKGKPNLKYSLRPVADHLAQMISPPIQFSPEVIAPSVAALSKALPDSGVLLVENVRFYSEEEINAERASLRPLPSWVMYTSTTLSVRLTGRMPVRLE